MSRYLIRSGVAGLAACMLSPAALAVEMEAGNWTFTANGNINVHYIFASCEDSPEAVTTVGAACDNTNGGDDNNSSISNGLLPAALVFGVSTTQQGFDISANFGLYPGISTNDGGSPNLGAPTGSPGTPFASTNTALGTTGLDVRQVFMTVSRPGMGTFTLGRNFGLFGFDAIINDMTIPGVGVPGSMATGAPANTSLGGIGFGYIYTDTLGQMNYTTPNFGGAELTIGIFDPIDPLLASQSTSKAAPGFHGKLSWSGKLGGVGLYSSAAFITQDQEDVGGPGNSYTSTGVDLYLRAEIGGLKASGYYYYGDGMGTTGLFVLADDGAGNKRESDGWMFQLLYPVGKTTLGVNYGDSRLDFANATDRANTPNLLEKNSKITAGAYHQLTENLTILAEFSHVTTEAHNGAENEAQSANIGAFLSF